MGRRGPAPKPTRLRLIGATEKRRKQARSEPTPTVGRPEFPGWIQDVVVKESWDIIADRLEELGVLTVADGAALEVLSITRTLYRSAVLELLADGQTVRVVDKHGEESFKRHPAVSAAAQWATILNALFSKFGLTPADRVRLVAGKTEASDPFEAFLRKQGQAAGRAGKGKGKYRS